jgi:hypothetical protein
MWGLVTLVMIQCRGEIKIDTLYALLLFPQRTEDPLQTILSGNNDFQLDCFLTLTRSCIHILPCTVQNEAAENSTSFYVFAACNFNTYNTQLPSSNFRYLWYLVVFHIASLTKVNKWNNWNMIGHWQQYYNIRDIANNDNITSGKGFVHSLFCFLLHKTY